MVTPVVRERLNSQGLLMPKIPKKIPNRHKNSTSFKMNTMVRFSFLMVCMAKLLSPSQQGQRGKTPQGTMIGGIIAQYAGKKQNSFVCGKKGSGKTRFPVFRAVWLLAAGAARPGFPVGKAPPFEKGRPPRHAAARGGAGTSRRVSHPRNSQPYCKPLRYESSFAYTKPTRARNKFTGKIFLLELSTGESEE